VSVRGQISLDYERIPFIVLCISSSLCLAADRQTDWACVMLHLCPVSDTRGVSVVLPRPSATAACTTQLQPLAQHSYSHLHNTSTATCTTQLQPLAQHSYSNLHNTATATCTTQLQQVVCSELLLLCCASCCNPHSSRISYFVRRLTWKRVKELAGCAALRLSSVHYFT
jgi:hypothetical protein